MEGRELGVLGQEDMALGGLGRAHGEGLLELAGGGAFAEGRGDAGRREVPEMGRERGERGALAEGGGGPCEAWGSAAARAGALTWNRARVAPRHVRRRGCALRLGGAWAGGRSLRAGHRGGEGGG